MPSSVVVPDVTRRIAEMRFCVTELRRRQATDRLRSWLWRLKEHAANQTLIMLLRHRGDESSVILGPSDQAALIARHSLLQDPRPANAPILDSRWQHDLKNRVAKTLHIAPGDEPKNNPKRE